VKLTQIRNNDPIKPNRWKHIKETIKHWTPIKWVHKG